MAVGADGSGGPADGRAGMAGGMGLGGAPSTSSGGGPSAGPSSSSNSGNPGANRGSSSPSSSPSSRGTNSSPSNPGGNRGTTGRSSPGDGASSASRDPGRGTSTVGRSAPGDGRIGSDTRSGGLPGLPGRSTPGMGPPSALGGVNSGFAPGSLIGGIRDAISMAAQAASLAKSASSISNLSQSAASVAKTGYASMAVQGAKTAQVAGYATAPSVTGFVDVNPDYKDVLDPQDSAFVDSLLGKYNTVISKSMVPGAVTLTAPTGYTEDGKISIFGQEPGLISNTPVAPTFSAVEAARMRDIANNYADAKAKSPVSAPSVSAADAVAAGMTSAQPSAPGSFASTGTPNPSSTRGMATSSAPSAGPVGSFADSRPSAPAAAPSPPSAVGFAGDPTQDVATKSYVGQRALASLTNPSDSVKAEISRITNEGTLSFDGNAMSVTDENGSRVTVTNDGYASVSLPDPIANAVTVSLVDAPKDKQATQGMLADLADKTKQHNTAITGKMGVRSVADIAGRVADATAAAKAASAAQGTGDVAAGETGSKAATAATASTGAQGTGATAAGSTAAKAAAAALDAAESSREPSVAATSLPGGTMTDAPSVADTVAQTDTTVSAQSQDMSGSWENRFGTGRSFYGSDSARAGAESISGKATKDARATAMRNARTEDPKAFVAATVLAELDPPQLRSLLSSAESQLEAKKILDVIANRALLGGGYTRGNGPLGGVLGETGTISAESLSDAAVAPSQFSPLNLTGDKATREANSRVMGFASGATNQAEMSFVLGLIDQMTQGGYTPATLDTHYYSKAMTKAPGWAKGMTRTKAGGHVFGSADEGTTDALIEAHANLGTVGSGQPTGSEIADRIAKALEMEGATRYDKEGNAYYNDKDGNLVDSEGNVVEVAKVDKSKAETESGDDDLGSLHTKTDPNRVGAPDLEGLDAGTKQAVVDLQKAWGKQLSIVSGYRDPARNKKAGGAKKSQHMQGNAVDIDVSDMTVAEKTQLMSLASAMGFGGIGVYSGGSLHLDTRKSPAMWGDNRKQTSVPKAFAGVKKGHLAGKFKGRADEFARATESEFSDENANLPERNPFTAEQSRIAQGLKDAPDSSIAPANEAAQGFANSIRDAIAKATADPVGTALGGLTSGGTGEAATANAGIGPTGAVPAPERNTTNDISAEQAAAADSSTGRQQLDAKDKAKEAYDAKVAEIAAKVAEVRADINANVTDMPKSDRQIAMSEAERKDQERASTALSGQIDASQAPAGAVPSLALGKVQRGEADVAVAGFEAGKTAPTATTSNTQFADKAPFSLDAALGKPGVLNGKIATATNTKAAATAVAGRLAAVVQDAARQGLVAQDSPGATTGSYGAADSLGAVATAKSAQAVARATAAGVKSAAATGTKTAEALAQANARIDAAVAQMGLPSTVAKAYAQGLKEAAAAQVANAGQVGQMATEADAYAPTKQGKAEAVADMAASFEQGTHYSTPDQIASTGELTAPSGLTSTPTDPNTGLPVQGMPTDQAIAESQKTVEISTETQARVTKIAETAKKQVNEVATKIAKTALSEQDKARAFTSAVKSITDVASRGIDALLRQEERKKREAEAKAAEAKAAKTKKGKKAPAVDPWMLALAQYMDALQTA